MIYTEDVFGIEVAEGKPHRVFGTRIDDCRAPDQFDFGSVDKQDIPVIFASNDRITPEINDQLTRG